MKKIMLAALVAIATVSCKKETPKPDIKYSNRSAEQQIAEMIQKHDQKLYDRIYGELKGPRPSIHVHHGIFHWPGSGDPADGTCIWNPNCVCFVCIDFPKLVTDQTPVQEITSDFHQAFANPGDGQLLINDESSTTINNLKTIDVTHTLNGNATIHYTNF